MRWWLESLPTHLQALNKASAIVPEKDVSTGPVRKTEPSPSHLAMRGSIECDSFILGDFALLCAIPLRDGCDVLDIIGRRLRARPSP
ncbi:hypothetical protein HNO86_21545 [Pseudomonas sp. C1C7]|nr:hypothetical protein [Pseudomonas sp. C1C7]